MKDDPTNGNIPMDLKDIQLREVSQMQRINYCISSIQQVDRAERQEGNGEGNVARGYQITGMEDL